MKYLNEIGLNKFWLNINGAFQQKTDINLETSSKLVTGAINELNSKLNCEVECVIETDDAATAILGEKWRVPSPEEWEELFENTTHTEENDIVTFTGNTGNSIQFYKGTWEKYDMSFVARPLYMGNKCTPSEKEGCPYALYLACSIFSEEFTPVELPAFVGTAIRPVSNEEGIDLGLPSGTKWAAYDLGETQLLDTVDPNHVYFRWADIDSMTPETGSSENYKYYTDGKSTKYTYEDGLTSLDSKNTYITQHGDTLQTLLSPEEGIKIAEDTIFNTSTSTLVRKEIVQEGKETDDTARAILSGDWRIPTIEEFGELLNNCTWTWTSLGGVNGYKVESKVAGNDNWIFLPAAENRNSSNALAEGQGFYWSSSLSRVGDDVYLAQYLYFGEGAVHRASYSRCTGFSVRAVSISEGIDLDLPSSLKWATCNIGATKPEEYGDYFAWGETEPKDRYAWDTYKFGTISDLTKYNPTDNLTTLELGQDEIINIKEDIVKTYYDSEGNLTKLVTEDGEEILIPEGSSNLNLENGKAPLSVQLKGTETFGQSSLTLGDNKQSDFMPLGCSLVGEYNSGTKTITFDQIINFNHNSSGSYWTNIYYYNTGEADYVTTRLLNCYVSLKDTDKKIKIISATSTTLVLEEPLTSSSGTVEIKIYQGSLGELAYTEGRGNITTALMGHTEGCDNINTGVFTHVEGITNNVSGGTSHVEGVANKIVVNPSEYSEASIQGVNHVEGMGNTGKNAMTSHVEGKDNSISNTSDVHVEGIGNTASSLGTHVEGVHNIVSSGSLNHVEGVCNSTSTITNSHVEGVKNSVTSSHKLHVEGVENTVSSSPSSPENSHVEGVQNTILGYVWNTHIEGTVNIIRGNIYNSHVEGAENTYSLSSGSDYGVHIEGMSNDITGPVYGSHIEGENHQIKSLGAYHSHIEGINHFVGDSGSVSNVHLEGAHNTVDSNWGYSHVEGINNTLSSNNSSLHIEGISNKITSMGNNQPNHVEGTSNEINGSASWAHVEGVKNIVKNGSQFTHVVGYNNLVTNSSKHVTIEGENNLTTDGVNGIHIEGINNTAQSSAKYSHIEGIDNTLTYNPYGQTWYYSEGCHLEGTKNTINSGNYLHVEGAGNTITGGKLNHVEGGGHTVNIAGYSVSQNNHIEGSGNTLNDNTKDSIPGTDYYDPETHSYVYPDWDGGNHLEGAANTMTDAINSHAEGCRNTVNPGLNNHAEGFWNKMDSDNSHIEGLHNTINLGSTIHVEGYYNTYTGSGKNEYNFGCHLEGSNNDCQGKNNHVEGASNRCQGSEQHVEGSGHLITGGNDNSIKGYSHTVTGSSFSVVEGYDNEIDSASRSHVEGEFILVLGYTQNNGVGLSASHVEGRRHYIFGLDNSHVEGSNHHLMTKQHMSHFEGEDHSISRTFKCSHIEGYKHTIPYEGYELWYVHMEGQNNKVLNNCEHALGKFNISHRDSNRSTIMSVGIGKSDTERKNAFEIDLNGNIYILDEAEGTEILLQEKLKSLTELNASLSSTIENLTGVIADLTSRIEALESNNSTQDPSEETPSTDPEESQENNG